MWRRPRTFRAEVRSWSPNPGYLLFRVLQQDFRAWIVAIREHLLKAEDKWHDETVRLLQGRMIRGRDEVHLHHPHAARVYHSCQMSEGLMIRQWDPFAEDQTLLLFDLTNWSTFTEVSHM